MGTPRYISFGQGPATRRNHPTGGKHVSIISLNFGCNVSKPWITTLHECENRFECRANLALGITRPNCFQEHDDELDDSPIEENQT
jgi:hypothetical protein